MIVLQWMFWILGGVLQVLALASVTRGPWKRFPVLTFYIILLALATVAEISMLVNPLSKEAQREYLWISNAIKQVFVFGVVLEFIWKAWKNSPQRKNIRYVAAGAVVVTMVAVFMHRGDSRIGPLMTNAIAYLSFYSAIWNLFLWSLLMRNRDRDRQLLTLTGGLGVQFTAEAIGQSVRNMAIHNHSVAIVTIGNVILTTGHVLCLFFWWQALKRPVVESAQDPVAVDRLRRVDPSLSKS